MSIGKKAAVIGGGIGGLTAALLLDRQGYEVEVYDKAQELKEIGAGICVWPNGMRVMRHLGLTRTLTEAGFEFTGFSIWDKQGKRLQGLQFPKHEVPGISIHRGALHRILLEAFPGKVHTAHRCIGLKRIENGLAPEFDNGAVAQADFYIGADGVHSALRQALIPDAAAIYQGYAEWRGVADLECHDDVARDLVELQGRGLRFGAFAVGHGKTAWWITSNEPLAETLHAPSRQQHLAQLVKDWMPLAGRLINNTPDDAIIRTPLFDLDPVHKWHEGNLCLLGDAIHASTPNLGQGACMAMEDAAVLASCLTDSRDNLGAAFSRYQDERLQRTALVQKVSRSLGKMGQWENQLAVWFREKAIVLTPASMLFGTTIKLQAFEPRLAAG